MSTCEKQLATTADKNGQLIMFDAIKKTNDLTSGYLHRGKELLRRLSVPSIPDSAIPGDIATWILETIEELLPLMPKNYPDYGKLGEIKTQYTDNQNILRPSARTDIYKVLQNLSIAHDCVLAALKADYKDIPPENLARMNNDQLKRLSDYIKEQFIGELKGREYGRTNRTATLNIYGRICLWIQSMIKLDRPEHCLALAASLRAILELYVDLNLIDQGRITDGAEKYFSFPTIEKWRSARSIIDMRNQFCLNTTDEAKPEDKYLSEPENSDSNIEALRAQLWGKTKKGNIVMPKHWTNRDLSRRVKLLHDPDVTDTYVSSYYWCNWCVHSMYFDMINNVKYVHLFNWHLYELAYRMFRSATELVNNTIKVLPKADLEASLKNIENETFKCFFGEMVIAGRNRNSGAVEKVL